MRRDEQLLFSYTEKIPGSTAVCPGVHTAVYPGVHTAVYSGVHTSVYPGVHTAVYPGVHTADSLSRIGLQSCGNPSKCRIAKSIAIDEIYLGFCPVNLVALTIAEQWLLPSRGHIL